jgi:hypothetical protein
MHPWEWLRTVSISISGMAPVYYLHPVWGIAIRNRSECWLWFHDNLCWSVMVVVRAGACPARGPFAGVG